MRISDASTTGAGDRALSRIAMKPSDSCSDRRWTRPKSERRPIETAPHDRDVLLGWHEATPSGALWHWQIGPAGSVPEAKWWAEI
jgi:hypothetical protein